MAEENGVPSPEQGAPNGADSSPQIGLISQYVKDLSFENPNAPAVYQWQSQPQIDIQFNIQSDKVADDAMEVILKIEVRAEGDGEVAFQVELAFAGLFGFRNVAQEQLQFFMLAQAPQLLFPFARRVVADAVRDGGFPPLMLDPIDFAQLYLQQVQAQGGGQPGIEAAGQA